MIISWLFKIHPSRALRDSNLPKFLHEDTILFSAILQDLFPGLEIPEHDYGVFKTTVVNSIVKRKLQPKDCVILKVSHEVWTLVEIIIKTAHFITLNLEWYFLGLAL